MAAKCKKEKKALEKAGAKALREEGTMGTWELRAEEYEAIAQREYASIDKCKDSEQRIDWECVTDKWENAEEKLQDARKFREYANQYYGYWQKALIEEARLLEKYCDCLDRQRSR
jgi:hypothetical protein